MRVYLVIKQSKTDGFAVVKSPTKTKPDELEEVGYHRTNRYYAGDRMLFLSFEVESLAQPKDYSCELYRVVTI